MPFFAVFSSIPRSRTASMPHKPQGGLDPLAASVPLHCAPRTRCKIKFGFESYAAVLFFSFYRFGAMRLCRLPAWSYAAVSFFSFDRPESYVAVTLRRPVGSFSTGCFLWDLRQIRQISDFCRQNYAVQSMAKA